jgi:hypothetical protein
MGWPFNVDSVHQRDALWPFVKGEVGLFYGHLLQAKVGSCYVLASLKWLAFSGSV